MVSDIDIGTQIRIGGFIALLDWLVTERIYSTVSECMEQAEYLTDRYGIVTDMTQWLDIYGQWQIYYEIEIDECIIYLPRCVIIATYAYA